MRRSHHHLQLFGYFLNVTVSKLRALADVLLMGVCEQHAVL